MTSEEVSQTTEQAGQDVVNDASESKRSLEQLAGKYMMFKLDKEAYGLEILKVREIIGLMEITKVPKTSDYMRGIINLRGKVIPVIDLRLKFGMEQAEETEQTVIIVVQLSVENETLTMGLMVDEVLEVADIQKDNLEPTPSFGGSQIDTDFILGIGKAGERVVFLLDVDKVISVKEAKALVNSSKA